jgi:hypothetical protein
MRFRKSRIAFAAVCAAVCVASLVMWARSGVTEDRLSGHFFRSEGFRAYSSRSCFVLYAESISDAARKYPWDLTVSSDYWLERSDTRISRTPRLASIPLGFTLTMPYWVIVLASTTGVLPLVRFDFRFSLRALMIATTAVGLVLGFVLYQLRG